MQNKILTDKNFSNVLLVFNKPMKFIGYERAKGPVCHFRGTWTYSLTGKS